MPLIPQDDLQANRFSKRLTIPDSISFGMQSNGALDLISTSQRVIRSSAGNEVREGVFSSSKLCSLYDKVLEVMFCIAAASAFTSDSIIALLGHPLPPFNLTFFDTPIQDNFECRMRASRRRTQRAFASRGGAPADTLQTKAL